MSRVESLLRSMTIEEKIGQLNLVTAGQTVTGPVVHVETTAEIRAGRVGGVFNLWGREAMAAAQKLAAEGTRLGVPLFFGLDILHGHRTIFPIPLAEAGAFDPLLWERTARVAAIEAAHEGVSLTFAPMLDVARDPRWGRIAEGPGEDPLVAVKMAEAKIRGFQDRALEAPTSIAATAKHFCAYGAATAGRDYAAVDVSERALHEIYLPPFRAAVEAGCAAIMPGFNSLAGVPMTAHARLLREYLRRDLGFDGVIISDYTAIAELIEHGVAGDLTDAAALALRAGVDMDMMSMAYVRRLPEALARGLVDLADVDAAARRVLLLKERLGLFDDPYRSIAAGEYSRAAHRELARDAARRSITLLSNDDILPLSADVRRIAVIGPLADARAEMLGPWYSAGAAEDCVTILEGLRFALPNCEVVFHAGAGIEDDDASGIAPACDMAAGADVIVLCLGEAEKMSGEAASRAMIGLPGRQRELAERILATGVPVVALLSSGRPLAVSWLVERARAVLATWFLGDMAGHAIADVLTGRYNPSARLAVTWPREVGQIPIFYASRSTGRPWNADNRYTSRYLDLPVEPLFPFGHGLSYSHVVLSNLRVAPSDISADGTVEIVIDAQNIGAFETEETIFVFVRDVVASIARPLMELKGWVKIVFSPGESRTVALTLSADSFSFPDENMKPKIEPGQFEILVGLDADRKNLLATVLNITST
ncbi:glycoside hydrolase family 3 C-terminal domain-containing protein [Methylocystis sp. WRRC1]|uniref:glycoside hydrolase family 3 N-terminal domain-containing protein n=1 Tax=Methylocystis sp. WRRC1 TaxID=1732014 RepID=UPI001D148918|nr:glycoside hydrolase family 3 N-terminal domain-containing protein [Methylocystis sp. WRRC1]MCC3245022.1 glycoside hydrolase family 3 C-terminal domain-containing protein [Methylocystis sp. WRRC1]